MYTIKVFLPVVFVLGFLGLNAQTTNPPIANDDFITIMGQPYSYFNPLSNDIGDSLTVSIFNDSCAIITYNTNANWYDVEMIAPNNFCEVDYVICNPQNECDTATITIEYQCYPWDYPLTFAHDTASVYLYGDPFTAFPVVQDCGSSNIEVIIDEELDLAGVGFSGNMFIGNAYYEGRDTFFYFVNVYDDFGCITCGYYVEHVVDVVFINAIDDFQIEELIHQNNYSYEITRDNFKLNLYNIEGKVIELSKKRIDISKLENGIYILTAKSNNKTYSKKIIKQ